MESILCFSFIVDTSLFLAEVDVDGAAGKVELLSESVLQETSVWLLDVLREVAEEGK